MYCIKTFSFVDFVAVNVLFFCFFLLLSFYSLCYNMLVWAGDISIDIVWRKCYGAMDSLLTFRYNFEHCSFECVVALLHISVMPGNEVMFSVFLFHLAVLDIRMIFTFDLQHLHTKILYGENVFNAFLICPFSLNYCTRISCLFFFFFWRVAQKRISAPFQIQ